MSESTDVASHLGIELTEYDARIRTFVPYYEGMLGTIAHAVDLFAPEKPTIVELGIGTGALAAQCLAVRPRATIIGIDADPAMLDSARARLGTGPAIDLRVIDYLKHELPSCNAIVSTIALHHVRTRAQKQQLYRRCRQVLRRGGFFLSGDCYPARDPILAASGREHWVSHLMKSYSREEAEKYLATWAHDDTYFPLADELEWLSAVGFQPEVLMRLGNFAVIMAR